MTTTPVPIDAPASSGRPVVIRRGLGDQIFRTGTLLAGLSVLAIMILVGLFLSVQAFSALTKIGFRFLTTEQWLPDQNVFGIASVLTFTVLIALVAVAV